MFSFVCEEMEKSLTEVIKVKIKKRLYFIGYYDDNLNDTFPMVEFDLKKVEFDV